MKKHDCQRCGGTGKIWIIPITAGKISRQENCPRCNRNGNRGVRRKR